MSSASSSNCSGQPLFSTSLPPSVTTILSSSRIPVPCNLRGSGWGTRQHHTKSTHLLHGCRRGAGEVLADIDSRLNSDHHTRVQDGVPVDQHGVVCIHPQIVPHMMRKQPPHSLTNITHHHAVLQRVQTCASVPVFMRREMTPSADHVPNENELISTVCLLLSCDDRISVAAE